MKVQYPIFDTDLFQIIDMSIKVKEPNKNNYAFTNF